MYQCVEKMKLTLPTSKSHFVHQGPRHDWSDMVVVVAVTVTVAVAVTIAIAIAVATVAAIVVVIAVTVVTVVAVIAGCVKGWGDENWTCKHSAFGKISLGSCQPVELLVHLEDLGEGLVTT